MAMPVSVHVLCVRVVKFGLIFKFKKESIDIKEVITLQR